MKVLFVHNYALKFGGISILNYDFAEYLRNKGYDVKIFSPAISENLNFVCNKEKNLKNLVFESDFILINLTPYLWPAILKTINYCKRFNKNFIIWFHNVLDYKIYTHRYGKIDFQNRLETLKEIFNDKLCSKIICVSFVVKKSIENLVEDKEKIKVIYPGVKYFSLKDKRNFLTDFIFVGRLGEEKNLERLIKAFKNLKNNSKLIIVGSGPLEENLKNLVNKLNLQKRINFIPYQEREKVFELISQSKFLINPSLIESLSLITIESILLGTPVILSKNPGHLEVTQGKFGLFFDPLNMKEITEKLEEAIKNYNNLVKITKSAKKLFLKRFYYEKQWFKYEKEMFLQDINFSFEMIKKRQEEIQYDVL